MSEIKFDSGENYSSIMLAKNKVPAKDTKAARPLQNDEGIAVQLSSLSNLMLAEENSADNARVLEMKQRIETNHYQINNDVLAWKLLPHLIKSVG